MSDTTRIGLILVAIVSLIWIFSKLKYDIGNVKQDDYKTTVIEGCEYFKTSTYMGYTTLVHKGNCNNPIHIYNSTK